MKKYKPMFLSWTRSFEEEMEEFKHLISCNPSDVKELKKELKQLKQRGEIYEN